MFYLIDKPVGISSFGVIRKLRKLLNIKKMGHTGTLDPLASGCLLIATENSTKLIPLLESSVKEYITTIRFDGRTESFDTETPIILIDLRTFHWKSDTEILNFLLLQKEQVPPKYSAIHIDGKRSYEMARKGKDICLKMRPIHVYEAEILRKGELEIDLRLKVSSGCYIRSFGPLLGSFLGVDGGYITKLRRTSMNGEYFQVSISQSSTLEEVKKISLDMLFHTIHTIYGDDELMDSIIHGRKVTGMNLSDKIHEGEPFFLSQASSGYTSLCKNMGGEVHIIKNNVN